MQTELNFVTPAADGTVRFVLDHGWSGTNQRAHPIELVDARPFAGQLRLGHDGFIIDRIVSGVSDYADLDALARLWFPAVERMILRVTGARRAYLFAGPNVRFSERDSKSTSTSISAPARAVHGDLPSTFQFAQFPNQPVSEAAWARLYRDTGGQEPRRWKVFNIWQMISPPPQDVSLAICALPSLEPGDYVHGAGYFADPGASAAEVLARTDQPPVFDMTFLRHNPRQKWCYFKDMLPGETLVFQTFDPAAGPGFGRVPHGAVTLPDAGEDAIPRSSIEIRALVVFDD